VSGGSFTLNPDGSFSYQSDTNYNGTDSFTYKANDDDLDSNVVTVNITIAAVNDAPVANDDTASTDEDVAVDVAVRSNDTDIENDTLTVNAFSQGSNGSVSLNGDGTLKYTPNPNYFGSDSFTYSVSDGQANSNTATVSVTIRPVNDAPVGVADTYSTNEDVPLHVAAPGVKGNDTDVENNSLTVILNAGPAHADSFMLNADGSFDYTPALNYNGLDSFTYHVCDNGQSGSPLANDFKCSGSVTVSINVIPVNDTPANVSASATPSTIDEDQSTTVSGSFTDPDATDAHTVTIPWGDGTPNASFSLAPGVFVYSVNHQYKDDNPPNTPSDVYTVSVTVSDGSLSSSASTSVTVNNVAPIVTSISGPVEPKPINTAVAVTTMFTDVGTQDTHTCLVNWDDGAGLTANGTVTQSSGAGTCSASKTFTTPGVHTVTVRVTDDDLGYDQKVYSSLIVIFDPNGGFVTGGGWIMSPAGACQLNTACLTQTGRANFGFVSKYKRGSNVPEGQTEFQFQAGNLNFHSSAYDVGSLVVQTYKAQYKGVGEINGQSGYKFVLTAYDGDINGGGNDGYDKFRIKITTMTGTVVYDNRVGASDDIDNADPLEISGGSINIQKAK
jgi:VCBS repeat-containing protein